MENIISLNGAIMDIEHENEAMDNEQIKRLKKEFKKINFASDSIRLILDGRISMAREYALKFIDDFQKLYLYNGIIKKDRLNVLFRFFSDFYHNTKDSDSSTKLNSFTTTIKDINDDFDSKESC